MLRDSFGYTHDEVITLIEYEVQGKALTDGLINRILTKLLDEWSVMMEQGGMK